MSLSHANQKEIIAKALNKKGRPKKSTNLKPSLISIQKRPRGRPRKTAPINPRLIPKYPGMHYKAPLMAPCPSKTSTLQPKYPDSDNSDKDILNFVTDSDNEDMMKNILNNNMNKFGPIKNPISDKDIEVDSKKCKSIINKLLPPINREFILFIYFILSLFHSLTVLLKDNINIKELKNKLKLGKYLKYCENTDSTFHTPNKAKKWKKYKHNPNKIFQYNNNLILLLRDQIKQGKSNPISRIESPLSKFYLFNSVRPPERPPRAPPWSIN